MDDEEVVIRVASMGLNRAGHTVHTAKCGAEAARIAGELIRIDVLIVDHRVDAVAKSTAPENGRAIAESLMLRHPDAKVIHISGYPRAQLEQEGSLMPGAAYLAKPFTVRQLRDCVAALLGS